MATIYGTSFRLVQTILNTSAVELNAPNVSATAVIDGITYLYVPAELDDAIQIFTVAADGTLTAVGSVADTGGLTLNGIREVRTFEVAGTQFLVAAGYLDDGITVFSLSGSPPYLTFADRAQDTDDTDHQLDGVWNIAVAESFGNAYVVAAGYGDAGISVFQVGIDGSLTNTFNLDDSADPALRLGFPFLSDPMYFGGVPYFAAGSNTEPGLTMFRLNSDGTLSTVASYDGATDDVHPYQSAGFKSGSSFYVVSTAYFDDALYLFRFSGASLTLLQTVSAPLLDQSFGIEVLERGDQILVISSSLSSEGVQVFEFDPAFEQLEFRQWLPDASGQGNLIRSHVSAPFDVDGTTFMSVSSETGDAINIYEIGGGDDVLEGSQVGDWIHGEGGDDVLYGLGGDDDLFGGNGTDILYGGSGRDDLDGGSGGDAVHAGSGDDIVRVSPGADRLYGGDGRDLLSAEALYETPGTGIWLNATTGFIVLPDGAVQAFFEFEDFIGTIRDDTLIGSAGDDEIKGAAGNDTLRGEDGDDNLLGSLGDDEIEAGDDLISGNGGDDSIAGGAGNDTMSGSGGNDTVLGGNGNDVITGDDGNDTVGGGGGDDLIDGGSLNDLVTGGNGTDTLFGGTGDDQVHGDAGEDVLHGGDGNDFLAGGGGNDLAYGGSGDDEVFGSRLDDTLYGGAGDDLMNGNADNDWLDGGDGNDTVRGSTGDDTLDGGAGNDLLDGGSGLDTFVFGVGGGTDRVLDFRNDEDTLSLSPLLWTGFLTLQEIVDTFAVSAGGDTTFTFAGGEVVVIKGIGDRQLLVDDLDLFT